MIATRRAAEPGGSVATMENKLTYYDVVAHLVPGTLVLGVVATIPRVFDFGVFWPASEIASVAAAIPIAYAAGQVVQGLSRIMQPLYYRLWGGMPSSRILAGGSTLLSEPRLSRIVNKLGEFFDAPTDTPQNREALFSDAMALCNRDNLGRVDAFNASYAFHRALLTAGLIGTVTLSSALIISALGLASTASEHEGALLYLVVLATLLAVVEVVRARQRGEHFAVEVLNMAYIRALQG